MKRLIVWLFLLLSFVTMSLHAEGDEKPLWILLEEAMSAYSSGDFGEALVLYENAIESEGNLPEAEYGLALIFKEQGELDLALRHLKKAAATSNSLYIYENRYTIHYEIAKILELKKDYQAFEEHLLQNILADDELFIGEKNRKNRQIYIDVLNSEGFERLITLYRMKNSYSQKAYFMLGQLKVRNGRYESGVEYLTISTMKIFSEAITVLRSINPDFEFDTLADFYRESVRHSFVRSFLKESGFFMNLYYLASSLYATGNRSEAFFLWEFISGYDEAGTWKFRSESQLEDPVLEQSVYY